MSTSLKLWAQRKVSYDLDEYAYNQMAKPLNLEPVWFIRRGKVDLHRVIVNQVAA